MTYKNKQIAEVAQLLIDRFETLENKADILKATELKALYAQIPTLEPAKRGAFGKEINALKQTLEQMVEAHQDESEELQPIDVTAPFDSNLKPNQRPRILLADNGSIHPMSKEIDIITSIFTKMGFHIKESRHLDDIYHMFDSLNFPDDHPARDDFDTFMTTDGLVAPAHTSTMQNRLLREYSNNLENGEPIAVVVPDRVYRNEDIDARHEHTFHQCEGIYVAEHTNAGMLIATIKTFLSEYYGKTIDYQTQPFYFPFTEPSFEFSLGCPFCEKTGCKVCGHIGWIELLGCGLIHPNVLTMAGIDSSKYSGFAWGFGIERLVMMKHDIEDIRHFESGKLDFLRQFS